MQEIIAGSYRTKGADEIHASGYVIHTLEAALWSFHRSDSFREAILAGVNLGDDADTTGAVCGQIAGAFYGAEGVPVEWLEILAMRTEIETLIDSLVSSAA